MRTFAPVDMRDSTSHVDLRYTLGLSEQFERDRSYNVAAYLTYHDFVDSLAGCTNLHRSHMILCMCTMIVHVRTLVLLAASAARPDKKREPNDRRQTTRRQVSFIDIDVTVYISPST